MAIKLTEQIPGYLNIFEACIGGLIYIGNEFKLVTKVVLFHLFIDFIFYYFLLFIIIINILLLLIKSMGTDFNYIIH